LQAEAAIGCKYKYNDDDVYKTVVLNIDERFLFERKQTPVKNALFILLPHYTATTTVSMQYTTRGTGVSRREDNNIIYYHCVYAYIYISYTRTRPIIYIGPFRYSSGPYPTYIRRRCHVYNIYNVYNVYNVYTIIYDISNVYSFPIGIIYIYTYARSRGARRAYLYIIIFPGQIAAAVTGCDCLCYHVRLIRAVVVVGLLIII